MFITDLLDSTIYQETNVSGLENSVMMSSKHTKR